MRHHRGGISSGGDHVKIADSLTPPPKAAGHLKFSDRGAFSQMRAELRRYPRRLRI
jgi:hypothetical protein